MLCDPIWSKTSHSYKVKILNTCSIHRYEVYALYRLEISCTPTWMDGWMDKCLDWLMDGWMG